MNVQVYDETVCALGEGPLWHPGRRQLFWFDITGKRLLTREGKVLRSWQFQECVSAAGWVDNETLLVASESALRLFNVENGAQQDVCPLEADNPDTRSNDGRADPWGGFWIGTMGKDAEPEAGAIYRFYRGSVTRLYEKQSIPNAICFDKENACAYFADTPTAKIWRQPVSPEDGWPTGEPQIFVDLAEEGRLPDGAVIDKMGRLWNAQWGGARVACYDRDGVFVNAINFPTDHTTCPAFGGQDLGTLYVTSATQGLTDAAYDEQPQAGMTFSVETEFHGLPENQIILS